MPLKKSFFNHTLYQKNLTRSWPLWGGLSIIGALFPLYCLLQFLTHDVLRLNSTSFARQLYVTVTNVVPIFLFLYAVLCAMLVWGYLYSPRAVGMMHTLPIDRTCLFVTGMLSGLTMILIPFVVTGGLLTLLSLFWGFFHPIAILNTVVAVICMAVLFFGLATFCAMLTGHAAALPVLYLLANFLAPLLEVLVRILANSFLLGVYNVEAFTLKFLSPLVQIIDKFQTYFAYENLQSSSSLYSDPVLVLSGMGTVIGYGLAGVVLLALAWVLYRRRQSEYAGDVAAFRVLRPVFRFLTALLSALSLGLLLYQLLYDTLDNNLNSMTRLVPMLIFLSLGGLVGYYVASMLIEKSLRVFRGSWRDAVIICAGVLVLCTVLKMDLFGTVDNIPAIEDLESVAINSTNTGLSTGSEEGRKFAEQVIDLHRAILAEKDDIAKLSYSDYRKANSSSDMGVFIGSIHIIYTLKDGNQILRRYTLIGSQSQIEEPGTIDNKIAALYDNEAVRLSRVCVPEEGTFLRVDVRDVMNGPKEPMRDDLSAAEQRLYEALLQDAREGNIPSDVFYSWTTEPDPVIQWFPVFLEVNYLIQSPNPSPSGGEYIGTKELTLCDRMVHTIQALQEEGYFSEADFAVWRDEYAEQ